MPQAKAVARPKAFLHLGHDRAPGRLRVVAGAVAVAVEVRPLGVAGEIRRGLGGLITALKR